MSEFEVYFNFISDYQLFLSAQLITILHNNFLLCWQWMFSRAIIEKSCLWFDQDATWLVSLHNRHAYTQQDIRNEHVSFSQPCVGIETQYNINPVSPVDHKASELK